MRRQLRKALPIQFVHEAHTDALLRCGALPLPVPALEGLTPALDELLEHADGVLLAEGGDIAPDRNPTHEHLVDSLKEVDQEKDALEVALAKRAIAEGIPTLGTCRGAQVLNLVAGGTLYSHLPEEFGHFVSHVDGDQYDDLRHPITLSPNTPLAEIFGDVTEVPVSSVHHQGVRDLAPGMVADAWSPDGLVEGFHAPDHPFLLAVQHHPERQLDEHPGHLGLYEALVDAARAYGR